MRGVAVQFDAHRTFVDDDHDKNLGRIRNRREPFQHLDRLELLRVAQVLGHRFNGLVADDLTDLNAGETPNFRIRCEGVAVNLNGDDRLGDSRRLFRCLARCFERDPQQRGQHATCSWARRFSR